MEGIIEVVILICLILIIILLAVDKVKIVRRAKPTDSENRSQITPDIMGQVSADFKENSFADRASSTTIFEKMIARDTLIKEKDIGTDPPENIDLIIDLDEESEEDFDHVPDDDRFSQGVSLEELSKVGQLLQNSNLDELQEKETVEIIQKMQGTEMFDSMQASIEGASQRIAKLLDKSLANDNDYRNTSHSKDIDNFDIGNFI
ncbi:hypothetical protein SAMN05443633_112108 [Chryseobacterium arachidis]|uniref:Conjugal transfer protein TraD n=1 Tax=Chryseobacterium arachidis TaxID=1416778 RepID=A0A1M5IEG4_9FLAO|nr:hypothetical protein [Chryseobacterium arachidis]SHG26665.1 hypothetical protein SAMN05443633_112108 [Chryseobacterium arachidis]